MSRFALAGDECDSDFESTLSSTAPLPRIETFYLNGTVEQAEASTSGAQAMSEVMSIGSNELHQLHGEPKISSVDPLESGDLDHQPQQNHQREEHLSKIQARNNKQKGATGKRGKSLGGPQKTKSVNRPSYLAHHSTMRSDDRPYGCLQCGRTFKSNANLGNHMRTHSSAENRAISKANC